jgi:hypothetical protein
VTQRGQVRLSTGSGPNLANTVGMARPVQAVGRVATWCKSRIAKLKDHNNDAAECGLVCMSSFCNVSALFARLLQRLLLSECDCVHSEDRGITVYTFIYKYEARQGRSFLAFALKWCCNKRKQMSNHSMHSST